SGARRPAGGPTRTMRSWRRRFTRRRASSRRSCSTRRRRPCGSSSARSRPTATGSFSCATTSPTRTRRASARTWASTACTSTASSSAPGNDSRRPWSAGGWGKGRHAMDHATIEDQQIVERYLKGKLSPEEAARFEEHYLSCQECLDRLDLAESMERGFKRAAGQDAAELAAVQQVRQLAVVAWLARLGRSRQMAALVMTVLVVAVLPGLFALRQIRERDRDLAATR